MEETKKTVKERRAGISEGPAPKIVRVAWVVVNAIVICVAIYVMH